MIDVRLLRHDELPDGVQWSKNGYYVRLAGGAHRWVCGLTELGEANAQTRERLLRASASFVPAADVIEALPDPAQLEALATWLDLIDDGKITPRETPHQERTVQASLRAWASAARSLLKGLNSDATHLGGVDIVDSKPCAVCPTCRKLVNVKDGRIVPHFRPSREPGKIRDHCGGSGGVA